MSTIPAESFSMLDVFGHIHLTSTSFPLLFAIGNPLSSLWELLQRYGELGVGTLAAAYYLNWLREVAKRHGRALLN